MRRGRRRSERTTGNVDDQIQPLPAQENVSEPILQNIPADRDDHTQATVQEAAPALIATGKVRDLKPNAYGFIEGENG